MRRTEGQGSPQVAGARWVVLGHFRHRPKPRVEVDGEVFGTAGPGEPLGSDPVVTARPPIVA
jgi:hypothetical protein